MRLEYRAFLLLPAGISLRQNDVRMISIALTVITLKRPVIPEALLLSTRAR